MPYSDAVGIAIITLENYLQEAFPSETAEESKPGLPRLLKNIQASIQQLGLTDLFLTSPFANDLPALRSILQSTVEKEEVFEYFAGYLALGSLYRIERVKDRMVEVIGMLPATMPPFRSKRYLVRVMECYLEGFDEEAIIMSRAAIEVLVEELWGSRPREELGRMIKTLKDTRVITKPQSDDMWEINRQAREVIHDEPHKKPIDPTECVKRLSRLLGTLHPVSG